MDVASVLRATLELHRARQYPGVAAVCAEALVEHPDNLYLRLLRARALLALRQDREAQAELAECCRRDPRCAEAYRLLGELGLRRDELDSATVFLREALRLDPHDAEAREYLDVAEATLRRARRAQSGPAPTSFRPATAAEKLPAAAAVAGHFSPSRADDPEVLPVASGLGRYLVHVGVLTDAQLRAALAYKKATGVRLGRAVTTLGFASELKVEWAAMAYHGRHRRDPS